MRPVIYALAGALALATAAEAQTAAPADLRARQEALFDQLLTDPDNLDLMFQHALVSIELGDFEAAISTLERMLIYNPKLSRAKVELGAAYFRLGAYENARFFFDDVLANDNPPPEVATRVNAFLDEINRRSAKSGFAGLAMVGLTYSSNANLGPSDTDVLLFGVPSTLDGQFVEADDFGVRAVLFGSHFYDMGQPDGDVWKTDLSAFSVHYFDETRGDVDSVAIRTGPRLSLTAESYGPKIRPFIAADLLRSDNDLLYASIGGGVEYSDPISDSTNVFAAARSLWREYASGNGDFDGSTHRIGGGFRYAFDRRTRLALSAYGERDIAAADDNSNIELGLRAQLTHNYDSGLDYTDRLWSITGFAQVAYREYDEPSIDVDPNRVRKDTDLRLGVSHAFNFTGGWFAQLDADYLMRDSNLPNFEIDNVGVTLSVGRIF